MPPRLLRATGAVVAAASFFIGVVVGGGNPSHLLALAGTLAACGALGQLYVARQRHEKQTEFDTKRHEEQTKSDFQRRITESFTKAVEQLASDKLVARLGGIYTLERISNESSGDYRIVMETLTAFVRENARWEKTVSQVAQSAGEPPVPEPATDIAAALAVLKRRNAEGRKAEQIGDARLDLRGADMRKANLGGANFESVVLIDVRFEQALLSRASLKDALLFGAHFKDAFLMGTNFEEARLYKARLEGTDLSKARGLTQAQVDEAYGDEKTILPEGLVHPPHWLAGKEAGAG